MEKGTVLIHIDEKQRDTHAMLWITFYLQEFGFDVYLCNRVNRSFLWEKLKPDIMIDSHINYYDEHTLAHMTKFTKLLILPAEGAIFNKHVLDLLYLGEKRSKKNNIKYVSKFLIWGNKNRQWLLEQNIIDEKKMEVVGCPRYDIYKNFKPKNPSKIGILTMFKTINIFDGRSIIKLIDELKYRQGYNFDKNRNVEDLFWYYVSGCRVVLESIENLCSKNDFVIKIRPHQTEAPHNYNFLTEKYNNRVVIDMNDSFYEWLENVYALIVIKSTSMIEALLMGIPVISLENLMGDRLDDHMRMPDSRIPFLRYCWNPKTYDELVELCDKAKRGELKPSPDMQGFEQLTHDFFDYPRKEPSSLTIAKIVKETYEQDISFFKRKKINHSMYKYLNYHGINRLIALKNSRSEMIKSNYFPWEKNVYLAAKRNWEKYIKSF